MNMKTQLSWFVAFIIPFQIHTQPSLETIFRNSYTLFELTRNEFGLYWDTQQLEVDNYHPASSAAIGKGLVSLCIASRMNWITKEEAEDQVLTTLQTVTNNNPDFNFITNGSGYPLHWFHIQTGQVMWKKEYSPIDAAILTSGALFAKRCFCDNSEISFYADLLWNSIDWSKSIENPVTGGIYRLMDDEGEGIQGEVTYPFNEYMIVAWLAMNQSKNDPTSPAVQLWNNHYSDVSNLPTKTYSNFELLTDHPNHFLSSFVIQFTYYLCHYFTVDQGYLDFFKEAQMADLHWWQNETNADACQWGHGAGHCPDSNGYCVGAINDNSNQIYSPHIIAGFLPVYPEGASDLIDLFTKGDAVFELPSQDNNQVLWRKSLLLPDWVSTEIQVVDFSTMLFGLAEMFPEKIGTNFFAECNDFFSDSPCHVKTQEFPQSDIVSTIAPNPTSSVIMGTYSSKYRGKLECILSNNLGQSIKSKKLNKDQETLTLNWNIEGICSGVYYVGFLESNVLVHTERIVVR